jgi:hypothetical protein
MSFPQTAALILFIKGPAPAQAPFRKGPFRICLGRQQSIGLHGIVIPIIEHLEQVLVAVLRLRFAVLIGHPGAALCGLGVADGYLGEDWSAGGHTGAHLSEN